MTAHAHRGSCYVTDSLYYLVAGEDVYLMRVVSSRLNLRPHCQENLIEQQKNGVHALTAPLDNLTSNWAYMVIASLAWSLKAWGSLLIPVNPRWRKTHEEEKRTLLRMDFTTFCQAMIKLRLANLVPNTIGTRLNSE